MLGVLALVFLELLVEVLDGPALKKQSNLAWLALPEHFLSRASPFSTFYSLNPFCLTKKLMRSSSNGLTNFIYDSRMALSFSTSGALNRTLASS